MAFKFNLTVWGGHISEWWAQIAGRMYSNYNRHLCELADLCLQEVLENLSWEIHKVHVDHVARTRHGGEVAWACLDWLYMVNYTTKYNKYTFHHIPNHSHSFPTFPHDFNMTSWHHMAPYGTIWHHMTPYGTFHILRSHPMKIPGTTGGLRGSVATVGLGGSQAVACHWHDGIEDLWRKTAELKGTETTHAVPRWIGRLADQAVIWLAEYKLCKRVRQVRHRLPSSKSEKLRGFKNGIHMWICS